MKKILIAAALAGLSATLGVSGAGAADMAVKARMYAKAPIAPAIYNWSGFYLGAHVGYGWGKSNWLNTASNAQGPFWPGLIPGEATSQNLSGVLGGGQVGYLWQAGSLVYGLELSGSGTGIRGNSVAQVTPFSTGDDFFETKIPALFLASAKLGYAANNWLFYAKGGYAGAQVKTSAVDTTPPRTGSGSSSQWHNGWNVGAGVEYGFTPNWSAALQYDYTRLETRSADLSGTNFNNGVAAGTGIYIFNVTPRDLHAVTARINYRFNTPVVAKY